MFRRIELIYPPGVDDDGAVYPALKTGISNSSAQELMDEWYEALVGPRRSLPQNCRFYFTEKGWRNVGRNVVAAARRTGQEYRIIAIKETDAQVVWRDDARGLEVAVQPPTTRLKSETEDLASRDISER